MKVSCQIRMGLNKEQCEDHALLAVSGNPGASRVLNEFRGEFEISAPCILAVADGVGGNPGGNEASGFVLRELLRRSSEARPDEQALRDLVISLNNDLISHAAGIPGKETMATTFSAVYVDPDTCFYLHTGNTRISVMHSRYLKQVTTDYTTYQFLLDHGQPEAAERCNKCEIISCMGGGSPENLSRIQAKHVYEGGRRPKLILLTSDGIHEFVDLDCMEEILADDGIGDLDKTDILIREALEHGSADDKTAVIVRFHD